MSKVEHVTGLVHEREELLRRRSALVAEIDGRVKEIEQEIELAWQGRPSQNAEAGQRSPSGNDPDSGKSNMDKIEEMITEAEGEPLDYGLVAASLYGHDTVVTRKRTRSSFTYLSRHGRIRKIGPNTWEVCG